MNTLIETPADTDPRLLKASVFSADQIQNDVSPPALPHPPPVQSAPGADECYPPPVMVEAASPPAVYARV